MGARKSKAVAPSPASSRTVSRHATLSSRVSAADLAAAEAAVAQEQERILRAQVRLSLLVQAACRGFFARSSHVDALKKATRRARIAGEILSTEESYVGALTLMMEVYMEPIRTSGFLNEVEFKTCFPQVETIARTNGAMLDNLRPIIDKWGYHSALGHVFVEYMDFLKSYITYVNNYNLANDLISRRRAEKPEFGKFLEKLARDPRAKNQDLFSYLIMPIQRVPRYVMLLSDLKSKTPEDHCDYENLVLASGRIKAIADHINDAKKNADNFQELLGVYHAVKPPQEDLVQPGRMIIARGQLVDFSQEKHPKGKVYFYFLFNDILIRCSAAKVDKKTGKSTYNYKDRLSLAMASVEDVADIEARKMKNLFQVTSEETKWLLGCSSSEKKQAWMSNVQAQVDRHKENLESFKVASAPSRKYVTKTLKLTTDEPASRASTSVDPSSTPASANDMPLLESPSESNYADGSAALAASRASAAPASPGSTLPRKPRPTQTNYASMPNIS